MVSFSIVMTLLVFNITVPLIEGTPTDGALLSELSKILPVFASYLTSFAVLAMFWIAHNFFYSSFTTEINRKLVLLNMVYLSMLALIPFSTRLLGEYSQLKDAVIIYGINVLAIAILAATVVNYAIASHEIDTSHISTRLIAQARFRSLLTIVSTLLGIAAAFFFTPLALLLFALPIVFNLIPGTLDLVERVFRFSLD